MKVFISQPMAGLSDDEIKAVRDEAKYSVIEMFPDDDVTFIDSFFEGYGEDHEGVRRDGVYWLGKAITLLSMADLAVFVKGYNEARGCRIENDVARLYTIPCLYL